MKEAQERRLRIARRGLVVTLVCGVPVAPLTGEVGTAVGMTAVVGAMTALCTFMASLGHRPLAEIPRHAGATGIVGGAVGLAWWSLLALGGPTSWLLVVTVVLCLACSEVPPLWDRWEQGLLPHEPREAEHDRLPKR